MLLLGASVLVNGHSGWHFIQSLIHLLLKAFEKMLLPAFEVLQNCNQMDSAAK